MTRKLLCSIALLLMSLGGASAPGFTQDAWELLPGDQLNWLAATDGASMYWLDVTAGAALCAGSQPNWCRVRYQLEPVSMNTAVLMDCQCPFRRETWYISFFVGEQPSLWEWYDIQTAAGGLIASD